MNAVTVSIVSHGHGSMLPALLGDLAECPEIERVIVTRNIPEAENVASKPGWLQVHDNRLPKGFGANHNSAFQHVRSPYFLVLNPDVRFDGNPIPELLACMQDINVALSAPAVVSPSGNVEDSARRFPTFTDLALKGFGRHDGRVQFHLGDPPLPVPWIAGMFMLLRSSDYAAIGGFDEGFFLYYEDVDLCARLWRGGRRVMLCPMTHVVHDARRASRRDLRHMVWHASSMARYFRKHPKRPAVQA